MSLVKLVVQWRTWCGLVLGVSVLSGCAVQQTGSGRILVGLDMPQLLGQQVASFKMADGSEGSLRVLDGRYSLKLSNTFKVVEVRHAKRVRVLRSEIVGARTVIVLEKSTDACPNSLELYSVQGRDVASWNFGPCRIPVDIERDGDDLYFSYVSNDRQHTTVYRDDRLMRLRPVRLRDLQDSTGPEARVAAADGGSSYTRPHRPRASDNRPVTRQGEARQGLPAIVPADADRYVPGLPIPVAEFQAALANEPFVPQAPVVRPTATKVATAEAPKPTPVVSRSTPTRPPRLSSDEIEGVEPVVRIKLN